MATRGDELTIHLGARVPRSLVARLDALAQRLDTPWTKASRSDAVRFALERGLALLESEAAGGRGADLMA
jgi:hypothetical protein